MKTASVTMIFQSMVFALFMIIAPDSKAQSDPVIAFMGDACSEFFDGIATIKEDYGSYFFINRKGEKLGVAPGKMIHSDSKCRIFDDLGTYMLTDKNNKIILKKERELSYVSAGMYFLSNDIGKKGGKLIDHNGKTIKEYDSNPTFHTDKSSSEVIVSYDVDVKENGQKRRGSVQDVFSNGEYLFTGRYISSDCLSPNYPFIFYSTYDSKSKRYSQKNVYVKANKKCIKLSKSHTTYIPGTNFFVNHDMVIDYIKVPSPDNFIFINRLGDSIPFDSVATNSSGNKIVYDKDANGYHLIDKQGNILSKELIQSIDPYLWYSGILAAKVNNKWGYFDQSGGTFLPFEYEYAGPIIGDVCAVIKDTVPQILYFYDKNTYKSVIIPNIEKGNTWLHNYYIDIIDGCKIIFWKEDVVRYGFYNIDKAKGVGGLGEIPKFDDGIACTYYKDTRDNSVPCLLSLDGDIKARTQNDFFKRLGENLYWVDIFDKDLGEYVTYIYSKSGELLYNSKSSGVKLMGKFHNGVAPVFVSGGLGENSSCYGYVYNTFSNRLEDVLMNYGSMGQDELVSKYNDQIKERIELLDYYQILGNKALEKGNYNAAISYFDKALSLNSIHNQSSFGKGIAYISLGEYKNALQSLQFVHAIDGADYATALCYYNLGSYTKAKNYISRVGASDPSYQQSLELKQLITEALERERIEKRERRWNKAIAILGAISNGLQLFSQSIATMQSPPQSHTLTPSYNYKSGNSATRNTCSSCHGTGLSSAKERAAFYSYSEETYSNSPCEVCGDRDSHYHKPCPSCMGKGYKNF